MISASGHATLWTDTVPMTADFCHIGPLQPPERGRVVRLYAGRRSARQRCAARRLGPENVKTRHGTTQANEKYPGRPLRIPCEIFQIVPAAAVGLYSLVTGTISIWSDVRYNRAFQFGEG